ncbi:MAG: hypothetical protein ACRD1H_13950, partial [Vicinamibacterales bacterium]
GALALSETWSVSCLWSRAFGSFEVQRSCRRRRLILITSWVTLSESGRFASDAQYAPAGYHCQAPRPQDVAFLF